MAVLQHDSVSRIPRPVFETDGGALRASSSMLQGMFENVVKLPMLLKKGSAVGTGQRGTIFDVSMYSCRLPWHGDDDGPCPRGVACDMAMAWEWHLTFHGMGHSTAQEDTQEDTVMGLLGCTAVALSSSTPMLCHGVCSPRH